MKVVLSLVVALLAGAPTLTLTGDKGLVIPAADIKAQTEQLIPLAKPTGSTGPILATYGNLSLMLSVRTANGVGELHQHFDDLMIVEQGSATLITGGSLIDPKPGANGEIRGTGVQGGVSRTLAAGDVAIVPAGLPHQLLIPPGTVYSSLVGKIKEP